MREHNHTDDRLTIGCEACIQAARVSSMTRPPSPDGLSADARRTKHNNELLASGTHPATRRKLLGEHTCGDCDHHHRYEYHGKHFHKCDVHRLGESHSASSDVRVSWPACVLWQATEAN